MRLVPALFSLCLLGCSYDVRWAGGPLAPTLLSETPQARRFAVEEGVLGGATFKGETVAVLWLDVAHQTIARTELVVAGDSVPVPSEAVEAMVCFNPRTQGRFSWGGSWRQPLLYAYRVVPVMPGTMPYERALDFTISAVGRAEADLLAWYYVSSPPRSSVPQGVQPGGSAVYVSNADGGVRVTVASLEPYAWVGLTVNGNTWQHSGLAGTKLAQVNGWWVVTFPIVPYTALQGSKLRANLSVLRLGSASIDRTLDIALH